MKPSFTPSAKSLILRGVRTLIALAVVAVVPQLSLHAQQCDGFRYLQNITEDVTVESDIVYGANVNSGGNDQTLHLDVYTPTGDSETNRPLIVMAHGGSFVAGSKTGGDVVPLCNDFARLGYVVASIEYRLGASDPGQFLPTPASATRAVWRGTHDARAAIRFFRKSVEEDGNPYGIDPDKIFAAGVSAGGFIALHAGYLNSENEIPEAAFGDFPGITNDLEGQSGNPGYTSEVAGVINIAGAIGDSAWIQADEPPVISFHGDEDGTVPYGSELLVFLGFIELLEVDGSASVHTRADELGMVNCFETHEGFDHVPHQDNADIYDTTLTMTKNFLFHLVCDGEPVCNYEFDTTTSVDEISDKSKVRVYPNPSSDRVFVDLSAISSDQTQIRLYNAMGAMVRDFGVNNESLLTIDRQGLPSGMYLLEVWQNGQRETVKILLR